MTLTGRQAALKLALGTIHFFIWFKHLLGSVAVYVWSVGRYLVKHKGTKLSCIVEDAKSLDKVPYHLGVVVGEESLSVGDIADVVCWAVAAGTQFVSLYDTKGCLRKHIVELRTSVIKKHQELFSPPLPDVHVTTPDELVDQFDQPDALKVMTSSRWVVLLSSGDSYSGLVTMSAELCQQAAQGRLSVGSIDPSFLTSKTQVSQLLPELNLVIVFSETNSLLGYPPWHTRLAEILWHPSHHKITYQDFYNLLQRYAMCHQRYGK